MARLSDNAIEIINQLHTERLDYNSEYLPLIEAANFLAAYEKTGMEPCDYATMGHALEQAKRAQADLSELISIVGGVGLDRLRELAQAEQEGRLMVLPCKEGTKVYRISYRLNQNHEIVKTWFNLTYLRPDDFGKTVFLTYEEAEAALKGGGDHA